MKRLTALILACVMALSLVACAPSSPSASNDTPNTTTDKPADTNTTPDPKPEVKKVTMKFAGTTTADPALGEYQAMLLFEELVEKYSDGSVEVEVYPASQLGGSVEFTEAVALGEVEACIDRTSVV